MVLSTLKPEHGAFQPSCHMRMVEVPPSLVFACGFMTLSNPWFLAALVAILGVFHLDLIATLLNLSRYRLPLPERLKGVFDDETVKKAAEYAGRSARVDLIRDAFFLALLIGMW